MIAQAAVSNCLLEDQLRILPTRMEDIRSQASKHEVTVRFLEPTDFEFIVSDAMAWKLFIIELTGPTQAFVLSTHGNIIIIFWVFSFLTSRHTRRQIFL